VGGFYRKLAISLQTGVWLLCASIFMAAVKVAEMFRI
jgi:hypothetical protein